ncbi:metallophosphoesterase [Pedobacter miscanthi]|uniref:metallophosphoesterase n=1 Tax=Pedobacter miscanthi TaxID=2259170 RepID=UPI0029313321|nr:metallophosphoesterase [Pedobacter miscanthi]
MKFQYCSDLHLEFSQNAKFLKSNPIIPKGDILLLAGDIVQFDQIEKHKDFFNYISDHFSASYWVPGNHEYYCSNISHRSGKFIESIQRNVTLLNNSTVEIGNTRLIFSTLWSNISQGKEKYIRRGMSDFHLIQDDGNSLSVKKYNALHSQSVSYIENIIEQEYVGNTVVISHHLPTFRHYPPQYLGSALNEAFATDLDELVKTSRADYWIYGHHHQKVSGFKIGETTLITNQLGYVSHNEHGQFNTSQCIELPMAH